MRFNERVCNLTKEGNKWRAESESGHTKLFDAVVMTQPTPQVLQLQGDIPQILSEDSKRNSIPLSH